MSVSANQLPSVSAGRATNVSCIVLDHDNGRLVRAWRSSDGEEPSSGNDPSLSPGAELQRLVLDVARREPSVWIGWRHVGGPLEEKELPRWNVPSLERLCVHAGLSEAERAQVADLGFIEQMEGLFTPNERRRCDWLLSEQAGWVHGSEVLRLGWWDRAPGFSHALLDFGRRASRNGMLCLVDPGMAPTGSPESGAPPVPSTKSLAGLIKRVYGLKWLLFWAVGRSLYGPGRVGLWPQVLRALFAARERSLDGDPKPNPRPKQAAMPPANGGPGVLAGATVSVVVPTLGRPRSVVALLRDLAAQSSAVDEVIVVEQGVESKTSMEGVPTDLPYDLQWIRVEWAGACRARNLAMSRARGDWFLLLDDDVRCPPDFLQTLALEMSAWGLDAASARVWTPSGTIDEEEKFGDAFPDARLGQQASLGPDWMWPGFAGGASMVRGELARTVDGFDERLDLGYGEDFEFGLRLREAGARFLHLQRPYVVHYHEPVGGFRAPAQQPWHQEEEPKPSPYILQSRAGLHRNCRRGYAMIYLLGALRSVRWPWRAPGVLRRWRASRRWALRLAEAPRGGIESWRGGREPVVEMNAEGGGGT